MVKVNVIGAFDDEGEGIGDTLELLGRGFQVGVDFNDAHYLTLVDSVNHNVIARI